MKNKSCTKCKSIKSTVEFKPVKWNKSGIDSQCICCREDYYQNNKEKIKLRVTKWAEDNKEKRKITEKKYRDNNKEKCKSAVKLWSDSNKDRVKSVRNEYKRKNKDIIKAKDAEYRDNNRKSINTKNRVLYKNNINKEKIRSLLYRGTHKKEIAARSKIYKSNNRHIATRSASKRRALKLNASPSWHETDLIEFIYRTAQYFRYMGNDVHVDHIVPLSNKIVCGLHCIDNLQILPAHKNLSKSNKFYG